MLKILYVCNSVGVGGAENSLLDMLESLSENVIPVVVVPLEGYITQVLQERNIRYYIIPFKLSYGEGDADTIENNNMIFVDNYEAALQVVEICKKEKVDLIHTNSITGNVGAMAAIISKIPHIWHVRELIEEHFDLKVWDFELKKTLICNSNKVVTISDCVGKIVSDKYECEVVTIYNAINEKKYIRPIRKGEEQKNIILPASWITKAKGQRDAVLAMDYLAKKGIDDITLFIIGNSDNLEGWALKRYAYVNKLENIKFVDTVNDLTKYREMCGYALTTSKYEALGRVTVEAMYAGNIVVGANSGGTEEIIRNSNGAGYLYEVGNYKSLANTLLKAMENSNYEIQLKAQKFALDNFAMVAFKQKMSTVYSKCSVGKVDVNNKLKEMLESRYLEAKHFYNQYLSCEKISSHENVKRDLVLNLLKKIGVLREHGITIDKMINYDSVSLYGFGIIGRKIYEELVDSGVDVKAIYDKNIKECFGIKINSYEEMLSDRNVVIISVVGEKELLLKFRTRGIKAVLFEELLDEYWERL